MSWVVLAMARQVRTATADGTARAPTAAHSLPSMRLFAPRSATSATRTTAQKISGHHGATSPRKAADARASAPGRSSATRPAAASSRSGVPPR